MKYLGIDIGTTNIKVIIYDDLEKKIVAQQVEETPVHKDSWGVVHDPLEIRDTVFRLLGQVVKKINNTSDIVGLSVASFGEEIVLLNDEFIPVGPAIAWFDERGKEEAKEFLKASSSKELFQTGVPDSGFSLFKLLWIKNNQKGQLESCSYFADIGGYITWSLCGRLAMDWSHASRTGMFDLFSCEWDEDVIKTARLNDSIFPDLVPSGKILGEVHDKAAHELGLPKGIKVVSGGHDHLCAAYGYGVQEDNEIFLSAGTSEVQLLITDEPIKNINESLPVQQGCFVDGKHYYLMTTIPSGRIFRQWSDISNFDYDEDIYSDLEKIPIGSNGVQYLMSKDGCKQSLNGLSAFTSKTEIVHAVLEGLAIRARFLTETLEGLSGLTCKWIVAAGHASKSRFWRQLRADVSSKRLRAVYEKEITAVGAAILTKNSLGYIEKQGHLNRKSLQEHHPLNDRYKELIGLYREQGGKIGFSYEVKQECAI